MNATIANYITEQKLKDGKFNVDDLQHYNLSLQVGDYDFRVAVVDSHLHRCLVLEDYAFPKSEHFLSSLQSLFEEHHFLKAGYWNSVKIAFKNNEFSLIPSNLFYRDSLKDYIDINSATEGDALFYYKHHKLKAVNTFSANPALVSFFTASYPGITLQFLHQTSVLIEGLQKYEDHSHQRNMSLLIEKGAVNILVYEEDKLLYCNRFLYSSPNKLVQYVMLVLHELHLDQYKTRVVVWGDIKSDAEAFEVLQTYIYNISFGGKMPLLSYGYVLDEIEDHNYFDLFSIYLCD